MNNEIVFRLCGSNPILRLGNRICKLFLVWSNVPRKSCNLSTKGTGAKSCSTECYIILKVMGQLGLQFAKLEQLNRKRFSVANSTNSCHSELGLTIVKKVVAKINVYVRPVENFFCHFFVEGMQFVKTGKFGLRQKSTAFSRKICAKQVWRRCSGKRDTKWFKNSFFSDANTGAPFLLTNQIWIRLFELVCLKLRFSG